CANDNMAMGAIRTFNANGLVVGRDISVTGFDNNAIAEYNSITTIDIPDYERGYLAAQALVSNIEGEMNKETFRITAKLIERTSVASSPVR
ncbi:MAG: substrate-binding domain-containing protein, partial [Sphaerochaetaceae bacterium]